MREFISIDFETGNPKRVSACAFGYARVVNGEIVEANGHLIKPVGGHASFQSKIHGIKDEHTFDKPDFEQLFPEIRELLEETLVAHTLFDQQVLEALSEHFGLGLSFEVFNTCAFAKERLPNLKDHKLKTLVKHFGLPQFKQHDAKNDAVACAHVCLKLHDMSLEAEREPSSSDELHEFNGLIRGILADDEVNYKEAFELLYWLEDHGETACRFHRLHSVVKNVLEDDELDSLETEILTIELDTARQQLSDD